MGRRGRRRMERIGKLIAFNGAKTVGKTTIAKALAALSDDVVDHYIRAAEWEQEEFDRVVTDWEIARGFERA